MNPILKDMEQPTKAIQYRFTVIFIQQRITDIRESDGFGVDRRFSSGFYKSIYPNPFKQKCLLCRLLRFLFLRNPCKDISEQF